MKTVIYISKRWLFLLPVIFILLHACSKEFPKNVESNDAVVLQSIKILNAGANGTTVVEGVIDENTKTVSFPRLDTATDFSAIRFEAVMSNGAKLDQDTYSFNFAQGDAQKTQVLKVVNNDRFREYFVTLRLDVPVYGADFSKATVYDYTNNDQGNPVYPDFVSILTRWTGFDGQHVLIVSRTSNGPHLLKVSDLKNNTINRIPLNLTGASGGTYAYSSGAQVNGHTYLCNLTTSKTSPLKIYHWATPSAVPELIASITAADLAGAGARHGDNMSANLDENGNGYMYFGDNVGGTVNPSEILRVTVTNYTTVSDPTILATQSGVTPYMTFNRVGKTDDYIFTGFYAPIMVANESASVSYTLDMGAVPRSGSDARVIQFNGERYLIMTGASRYADDAVVLYVYNITNGDNTIEALTLFNARADKSTAYQYPLLGPTNAAPGTQTGWYVTKDVNGKDDKLTLYAASADAGFVLIDFPKKVQTD